MLRAYVTWITLPKKYLWGIILLSVLGFIFVSVLPAFAAFDAMDAANKVLGFIQLVIIVAAAAAAITLFIRSQIVPAVILVVAAALVYVLLDPNIMKDLGQGFANLIGLGSSGANQ